MCPCNINCIHCSQTYLHIVKPVLSGPQKEDQNLVFKTVFCLMQAKSIAECSEHSAILPTFIKLPFVIKIFVLSFFEWPLMTGFTVIIFKLFSSHWAS